MNMRQGSRNGNGWFRSGFFIPGNNQRAYPNPARLIKRVFHPNPAHGLRPKSQTQKKPRNQLQIQNHKSHNIHVIFLAITAFSWKFSCHPNGCQDLTNQSVQQIPEIKLANLKIPATKHQKNPTNLAHTHKKKNPNPNFAHKNTKRKKPKPHRRRMMGVFTVDL